MWKTSSRNIFQKEVLFYIYIYIYIYIYGKIYIYIYKKAGILYL